MDMNQQNGQITPQMLQQALQQMLQQNGQPANSMTPMMNWTMPTHPMAALWMNNMMNMLNNQNNQNQQQNQNTQQPQETQPAPQKEPNISSARVIKSPEEIKPDEILMNGSVSLFLQEDMNVVYGKRWTNNGVLENIRFVREDPVPVEQPSQSTSVSSINLEELAKQISDMIDGKLEIFKRDYIDKPKTAPKQAKKGVSEDGE